jgi:hypothetical protein
MASSVGQIVSATLDPLVQQRVFPGIAPAGTLRPYITYQRVGGQETVTFDGPSTTRNARVQINVWSDTGALAGSVMDQVLATLCSEPILGVPLGEVVDLYEEATKLYGTRLDFSIWYST